MSNVGSYWIWILHQMARTEASTLRSFVFGNHILCFCLEPNVVIRPQLATPWQRVGPALPCLALTPHALSLFGVGWHKQQPQQQRQQHHDVVVHSFERAHLIASDPNFISSAGRYCSWYCHYLLTHLFLSFFASILAEIFLILSNYCDLWPIL